MIDFFFIILFFLVPVFSLQIIKLSRIDVFRVSVPSIFILYYLAGSYIGILFLYFGWDSHALLQGVNDKGLILKMFYLSAVSLLLISIGVSFIPVISNMPKLKPLQLVPARPLKKISLMIVSCIFAFSSIILYFYIKYLPDVPFFHVLMGDPLGAVNARITLLTTNKFLIGKASYYNIFIRMTMPFLCYLLFAESLISKRRSVKLMFAICFVITAFGNVLDTSKGPLVWFLLGLFLTYMLLGNRKLSLKYIVVFCIPIAFLTSIMMVNFMGTGGGAMDKVSAIGYRMSLGNLVPSYYVVNMFEKENYLLGRSFPNPKGLLPYEQYLLDQEIWLRVTPVNIVANSDRLYTAPSGYWAEMYANFGPYGVMTAPLVGFILYIMQLLLNRLPHNSVKFALIVWCTLHYMTIPIRGIFCYFWDYYLIAVLLIAFFILIVDGKGVIKLRRAVPV